MKFIDDLPFYLTIFGVILNIVIGITTGVDFTILMWRSIAVTIVFALLGFMLSYTLGSALKSSKEQKLLEELTLGKIKNNSKDTQSSFDVSVPPMDENELLNYDLYEEEFREVSPAYLHTMSEQGHEP